MATTYPDSIQTFPEKSDINPTTDTSYLIAYQNAVMSGDIEAMQDALNQIPDIDKKLITSEDFNTLTDTCYALQEFFNEKYSPAYIISETKPASQQKGDFWIRVDSTN